MRYILTDPLESAIVQLLADHDRLAITEIQTALNQEYKLNYTRQHLYKVVAKMIQCGILSKIHSKISIDFRWAAFVHTLSKEILSKGAQTSLGELNLDLKEGQSKEFAAESMRSLISLWDQLYLVLMNESADKCFYEYVSHAYWAMCMPTHPNNYRMVYSKAEVYRTVIGNDTPLDQHTLAQIRRNPDREAIIALDLPFQKTGYELEVIGDFIVELYLPERTDTLFEFLFHSLAEMNEQNMKMLLSIFDTKEPLTLTVRRDPKAARSYRKLLENCFAQK